CCRQNFTCNGRTTPMNSFLARHDSNVTGMICGWDRVRFRGTLRVLASVSGLSRWLAVIGCLLKDFGDFALDLSERVKLASLKAEPGEPECNAFPGPQRSREDSPAVQRPGSQ